MSFRLFDEIDPLQFGEKACILLVRARSDKGQKLLVLPNDKVILRDDFFASWAFGEPRLASKRRMRTWGTVPRPAQPAVDRGLWRKKKPA